MSYLVLLLLLAATWHLVYESVIAPSLRRENQFHLFALRDRLRRLKIEYGEALNDTVFSELQDSINVQINFAKMFELTSMYKATSALKRDPSLYKKIDQLLAQRARIFQACPLDDIDQIRQQALQVAFRMWVINAGGWAIYLLPIIVGGELYRRARAWLEKALMLRELELARLIP